MMSNEGAPRANEMVSGIWNEEYVLDRRNAAWPYGAQPTWSAARSGRSAQQRDRQLGHVSRRAADADASGFERLRLGRGRPPGARHDRAGVAHGLAGRGRETCDVCDHWLGHVLGDEFGCPLLGVTPDLAAHDDQLGLGVVLEQPDHVDEVRTW